MRLEVLADNKGAVVYVLNRPEVYIGSAETNDIVISSPEISKKHLKLIITDDQKCFVIDQGSTNGSFLSDERLVPGRREEFVLLTSLRLGDKVLLTLLDKDTGETPDLPLRDRFVEEKKIEVPLEDRTRVISLKTLQKTKTEKVKKKRLKQLEKELKKKKQVRKDKSTLNQAILSAGLVIVLGFGAMKLLELNKKRRARKTIVSTLNDTRLFVDEAIESADDTGANLISDTLLIPVSEINRHFTDAGCVGDEENFFCKRMPRGSLRKNGVVNINGQIAIYLEQREWMAKALELVSFHSSLNPTVGVRKEADDLSDEEPSAEKASGSDASVDLLNRIAFLVFLKTHLKDAIPPEIQEKNLYFVFYDHAGSEVEVKSVMAIKGVFVPRLVSRFSEDYFKFSKYNPYNIIPRLDRFYRTY